MFFQKKVFSVFFLMLIFSGCTFSANTEKKEIPQKQSKSVETETKTIKIGIVPSVSPVVLMEQSQPLMDYLSEKLNTPVELVLFDKYEELIRALENKETELVIAGSLTAYEALSETGAIPLARPEKNKISTYRGVIFVRKNTGIKSLSEMKNRSFAYVNKETSAGYIFPRAEIKKLGKDPDEFFSSIVFGEKHDLTINKVLDGGAVKNTVYYKTANDNPRIKEETAVIMESKDYPDRTFLARRDFDSLTAKKIKTILMTMKYDGPEKNILEKFVADRFIETGLEDFNYLQEEINILKSKKQ
jgi:phosphonate transport system substrate-binding protein